MNPNIKPLYVHIASLLTARANCARPGPDGAPVNPEWFARHSSALEYIAREILPSGSGVDSGTTIDLDASREDRIVLHTSFHHMHESGMYDGWTEHKITIRPSLVHGFDLTIGGRDRNGIKEYLGDLFYHVLVDPIESTADWYSAHISGAAIDRDARAGSAFAEALETQIQRAARKAGPEVES